ncbi:MAG: hypothetical protein KAI07_04545 [Deltaproteobacteria bacterium]|nr:hypothetical protein [Deltaproteobacteria bacterium]
MKRVKRYLTLEQTSKLYNKEKRYEWQESKETEAIRQATERSCRRKEYMEGLRSETENSQSKYDDQTNEQVTGLYVLTREARDCWGVVRLSNQA